MFRLVNIALINWHLIDIADIEIDESSEGIAGILGENRSGKSTLLDLVQTVMTGNNGRYLRLNASANEEGKKRNQRTVRDYCLGRYGGRETPPKRKEALTYLVLAFHNRETGSDLSIGIAIAARIEEKDAQTLALFIAPGVRLSAEDFVEEIEGKPLPVKWPIARGRLVQRCADRGTSFVDHDHSLNFVGDYLKLMTPHRPPAVKHFLKAFGNAVSFETMDSATDFVRDYVLEERPIRIEQLREAIRTYQGISQTIKRLKAQLDDLVDIEKLVKRHEGLIAEQSLNRWVHSRADLEAARRAYAIALRHRETQRQEFQRFERLIAGHDGRVAALETRRAEVDALIAQSGVHERLLQNKISRQRAERERDDAVRPLAERCSAVTRATAILRDVAVDAEAPAPGRKAPLPIPVKFAPLLETLRALQAETGADVAPTWPRNPDRVRQLLDEASALPALSKYLSSEADACIEAGGRARTERDEIAALLRNARERGQVITPQTADLFAELQGLGMQPKILCSLVEVLDEEWRDAAEALLGRDREALIVDPEHATAAIQHLRREKRRFFGCRIANTRKITLDPEPAPADSLAAVLRVTDPLADAFVKRRIGGVRRAETVEDLHRPGRAIMRDCTYDDGLAVETRRPDHHKLGASASQQTAKKLEQRLYELEAEQRRLSGEAERWRRVAQALAPLIDQLGKESVAELATAFEAKAEMLRALEDERRAIEKNIDPGLQQERAEIQSEIADLKAERTEHDKARVDAQVQIAMAEKTLSGGDLGSHLRCQTAWKMFQARRGLHSRSEGKAAFRTRLHEKGNDSKKVAEEAARLVDEAKDKIVRAEGDVFDALKDYALGNAEASRFQRGQSSIAGEVRPWLEQQIDLIRNNSLISYAKQAEEAAETMNNVFKSAFVTELQSRFDELRAAIDRINQILGPHRFHYEQYQFSAHMDAFYEPIVRLVDAARNDQSVLLPLFGATPAGAPESPHAAALAAVQATLLDDEADITKFEDYRRYFTFQLRMSDAATGIVTDLDHRRGIGSGAEKQVPFYVAIGAALAAAYHGQNAGKPGATRGVGLALFDEAFSKMDASNQHAMLEFYRHLGLQPVIAAPYDKRSVFLEVMDTLVEVWRDGTRVELDVEHLKETTHAAVRADNPIHLSVDDIRAALESKAREAAE
ncbi:MAG: hypothetical protein JO107_15095 [Hyphomicrobiales bacterium]|nr:hypothetical protein [Hyphomicrobiales bacterium]MBV8664418.1 hypothetical protein [Hyphomicrobiales bacterium]